jgi:hypothetical protein
MTVERNLCLPLRLMAITNDPLEGGMCQVCVEIHITANFIRNVSFYVMTLKHEGLETLCRVRHL